jgi:ketosteroid isomerase-like protein/uncharacterized protein YndB with AHSA1/START domain
MTSEAPGSARILGSLGSAGDRGVVRMQDRLHAAISDVWSAITDPARLARWYGEVTGDLRPGGEFRSHVFASGWEGTGRVEACDAPRHLALTARDPDEPHDGVTDVTLTADGDHTVLVWEQRGMPLDYLAGYGAGIQVHVEDLGAYLAGRGRCAAGARMDELLPLYADLAARRDEETQVRAVLENRAAALRVKDAARFVACFDPSAVKFDFAPPLQESGSSVVDPAGLQWWLDTWDGNITYELADLTIAAGRDVAFCHSLVHVAGTRTDGEHEDMWTRSTLGLRKVDGAWKIAHEHNSAPFYMDGTNRPALDLKP